MISSVLLLSSIAALLPAAKGHACAWHPSMYGFNVTAQTFDYDNRPVVPLIDLTFDKWWFHNHMGYPPNDGDFLELPAGGAIDIEIACDKGYTSYYASSEGGDIRQDGTPSACPGQDSTVIHANNEADTKGTALAIAYKSDPTTIVPEDFVIISVVTDSVWNLHNSFEIPAGLPECPEGGCHCSWNWVHAVDSGAAQIYQNVYKCKVTGQTGTQALGIPMVPRRCGADSTESTSVDAPGNCTIGAKQALYWFQADDNNIDEGQYSPPYYNGEFGFSNGAQNDVFTDGYISSLGPDTASTTAVATTTPAAASTTEASVPPVTTDNSASAAAADPSTPASTTDTPIATSVVSITSSPLAEPSSTADSSPVVSSSPVISSVPSVSSFTEASSTIVEASVAASTTAEVSSTTIEVSSTSVSSIVTEAASATPIVTTPALIATSVATSADSSLLSVAFITATPVASSTVISVLPAEPSSTRRCKPRPTTVARREAVAHHARRKRHEFAH